MPTGYTYPIYDGTVTDFKSFVWRCAKGMGAMLLDRDNNRPADWVPTHEEILEIAGKNEQYHDVELDRAKTVLEAYLGRTEESWQQAYVRDKEKKQQEYEASYSKNKDIQERYKKMLEQVKTWVPPSSDHHEFKELMMEQLAKSLEFDAYEPSPPVVVSLEKYKEKCFADILRSVNYHQEKLVQNRRRIQERREWMEKLARSLGQEIC